MKTRKHKDTKINHYDQFSIKHFLSNGLFIEYRMKTNFLIIYSYINILIRDKIFMEYQKITDFKL